MYANPSEEPALLKHIIGSVSTMLPSVLRFMKDSPTKDNKDAWDVLLAFIRTIVDNESSAKLDAAGVQATHKVLEVLIALASDEKVSYRLVVDAVRTNAAIGPLLDGCKGIVLEYMYIF